MFILSGTSPVLGNGDSVDKTRLIPAESILGKELVCEGMGDQSKGKASQGQSDRPTRLGSWALSQLDRTGITLQTQLQVQSSLGVLQA